MTDAAYHRPATLDAALVLKAREPTARYVAGGTDLWVQARKRKAAPVPLISLQNIAELRGISVGDKGLRIGATTPLSDLLRHELVRAELPALAMALGTLASQQIRNVATVAGNLCNASPAADTAPPLLVHDASVELRGASGARTVSLASFLVGPGKTTLAPGELLAAIVVPRPAKGTKSAFLRQGRVAMDLSLASVAALVCIEDDRQAPVVRLAAGAVGPVPMRLPKAEAALAGRPLDAAALVAAAEVAADEVAPITDLRASAGYRRRLVRVLCERALRLAVGDKEIHHEVHHAG
ncbi:MAG: xanthine dehydrogenase family protein subunit M [Deltaproteobacteria bacterium]|nr:xanthine dehydrogenase family protein subunit M [Deltaproteobacteria bacterium]